MLGETLASGLGIHAVSTWPRFYGGTEASAKRLILKPGFWFSPLPPEAGARSWRQRLKF